jgi:hypothetical protein
MKPLLEIAKDKLDNLDFPVREGWSILPQLMLLVFNEETPDNLDLNIYDRQEMEDKVMALLNYSDKAVWIMLGLNNKEREEEIQENLLKAKTRDEIRDVLIADLLYNSMAETSDSFPNQLRISPAEKNQGEAFL